MYFLVTVPLFTAPPSDPFVLLVEISLFHGIEESIPRTRARETVEWHNGLLMWKAAPGSRLCLCCRGKSEPEIKAVPRDPAPF